MAFTLSPSTINNPKILTNYLICIGVEKKIGEKNLNSTLKKLSVHFVLPMGSFIFTVTFWIIGLVKSYSSGYSQGPNMFECLAIEIS